tara:strand:- start:763 stop:987 length:225 start_codon:yes stop_codon:yes gene_type:complete
LSPRYIEDKSKGEIDMEVDITVNYHTPEEEFIKLGEKHPTGYYKESDGTEWFTLIIEIEPFKASKVKLVWFKEA